MDTINNLETGLALRTKLNANFAEAQTQITSDARYSKLTRPDFTAAPNSWRIGAIGNSLLATGLSFWHIATSLLQSTHKENKSVGGVGSSALAAQVAGLSSTCTHCIVMEGTNDAVALVTTASHITNLKAAVTALHARNIRPIVVASPTRNASAAQALIMAKYALAERIWCEQDNLIFVDPWSRYIGTDGLWTAGATSDGDHPFATTHYDIAQDMYALINANKKGLLLPRINGTNEGLLSNPLGLADADLNGLPDGWGAFGMAGTYALATEAYPGRGNKCTATIVQSATVELYRSLTTGYAVGDRVRFTGMISTANMSNANVRAYLRPIGEVGGIDLICTILRSNASQIYFSGEYVVASAVTELQLWLEVSAQVAGAYTANVSFAGVQAYNLTTNTF